MSEEVRRGSRKSSLRSYEEFLGVLQGTDDINYESFVKPYVDIKEGYENCNKLLLRREQKKFRCWVITFKTVPDVLYVAFGDKDKCKGEATKYFRDNYHPAFLDKSWKSCYTEARAIRHAELDKYYVEKKVPIPEIMKLGASFPCSICGKENFTLKEYEGKRCYIVEGEGDVNTFTKGYVLCYNCYKNYLSSIEKQ